jgi:hypothetical protein
VALKTLNLAGCFSIIGLQALAPLVALETLNLDCCKRITDADLMALAPLVALKTLNLCGCDKITDVGLQALTAFRLRRFSTKSAPFWRFAIWVTTGYILNLLSVSMFECLFGTVL